MQPIRREIYSHADRHPGAMFLLLKQDIAHKTQQQCYCISRPMCNYDEFIISDYDLGSPGNQASWVFSILVHLMVFSSLRYHRPKRLTCRLGMSIQHLTNQHAMII